jgi:NAD(P)-dependent dehydrogenase (short-subunit alcohol dehydrogenase family)
VGAEDALAATAEESRRCAGGGEAAVAVVGLDFEACDEAAAGAAVEAAWRCFGDGLDALVNCCSYEGKNWHCDGAHAQAQLIISLNDSSVFSSNLSVSFSL